MKLFLIVILIALSCAILIWRIFNHQSDPLPEHADAVVVFAGGPGERLAQALKLMEAGVASTLILHVGAEFWPRQYEVMEICNSAPAKYAVKCFTLITNDNTAGEASAFGAIAEKEKMNTLVLVTSEYHLVRAKLYLNSCFNGRVHAVGAKSKPRLMLYLHELGGIVEAIFLKRKCVQVQMMPFPEV